MTRWSLGGATVDSCGGLVSRLRLFLAFGMLPNNGAGHQVAELDEPWAEGGRTRIRPGLFDHITTGTNR